MPKQGYGSTRAPRGPHRVGESKKRKGRLVGTKKGSRKQKLRLGNAKYKMGQ